MDIIKLRYKKIELIEAEFTVILKEIVNRIHLKEPSFLHICEWTKKYLRAVLAKRTPLTLTIPNKPENPDLYGFIGFCPAGEGSNGIDLYVTYGDTYTIENAKELFWKRMKKLGFIYVDEIKDIDKKYLPPYDDLT